MNLHVLEIPEGRVEIARWLERKLVSTDLSEFVAELTAFDGHGSTGSLGLNQILHKFGAAIFDEGLSGLPEEVLRSLLRSPKALYGLQEQVLVNGGPFWAELASEVTSLPPFQAPHGGTTESQSGNHQTTDAKATPAQRHKSRSQVRRIAVFATALSVVIAIGVGGILWFNSAETGVTPVAATGWGWDRPGALKTDLEADQYLRQLADSANEWFSKRPDSPEALEKRLGEFLHGCQTLIAADHKPLAVEDREWLVGKCKAWAEKLEGHLASLESNASLQETQEAADETIRNLLNAMRQHADELAA